MWRACHNLPRKRGTFDEAGLAIGTTISPRKELADEAGALSKLPLSDFAFIIYMKPGIRHLVLGSEHDGWLLTGLD
jgi:hypothetical protein